MKTSQVTLIAVFVGIFGYALGAMHAGSNVASIKCLESARSLERVKELAREGDTSKIQAMAQGLINGKVIEVEAIHKFPTPLVFASAGFWSSNISLDEIKGN